MSPQAGFLLVNEIVPRLRSSIPGTVRAMAGEDLEELVQDGTAIAAQILHSAESRGQKVSAGNVAFFATKYLKIGRRSTGFWRTDPLHPAAQACGHSRVHSLEEPVAFGESGDEPMVLADALASNLDDPGAEAARRLDWSELEEKLDKVARAILQAMVAGQELTKLVKRLRKCRSGLQGDKNRLAAIIKEKLGPDILAAVQERAAWRSGIDAGRERMACRWERMAA
jgi:hypothetical protein